MDNTLNEIRRRISLLRSQMLATEDVIRKQIDRDEDCTDSSLRLMAMRTKMLRLISDRDSLGGSEPPLNVEQQLTAEHPKQSSPPSAKVLTAETRGRDI